MRWGNEFNTFSNTHLNRKIRLIHRELFGDDVCFKNRTGAPGHLLCVNLGSPAPAPAPPVTCCLLSQVRVRVADGTVKVRKAPTQPLVSPGIYLASARICDLLAIKLSWIFIFLVIYYRNYTPINKQ